MKSKHSPLTAAESRSARRIEWIVLSIVWVALSLSTVYETLYFYRTRERPMSLTNAWELGILFGILWLANSDLIIRAARHFPVEKPDLWRNVGVHIVLSIALGALNRLVFLLIANQFPGINDGVYTVDRILHDLLVRAENSAILYWVVLAIDAGSVYYVRYQSGLQRQRDLESQLARSQLETLKMQLQPHFLFNTLNTISAMIQTDPVAADRMVLKLGAFLRLSLSNTGSQEVPLAQELRFAETYLAIQKVRFEDRLQVKFKTPPETLDAQVPNLILQPLVENAVKHGLAMLTGEATIEITSRLDGARLILTVENNGATPHRNGSSGVGLSNTRARLNTLYGSDSSFALNAREPDGATAVITIPYRAEVAS